MLPKYILTEAPNAVFVVGVCEWQDLLPCFDPCFSVKPLYSSHVSDVSGVPTRTIRAKAFFDLKTRVIEGETCIRTERQIVEQVSPFLPVGEVDEITSLLRVDASAIHRIWEAPPLTEVYGGGEFCDHLAQLLRSVFDDEGTDPALAVRLIGSRLYDDNRPTSATDMDLAIACTPSECERLRTLLSYTRMQCPEYVPRESYFAFPFRFRAQELTVDILPCLPKDVWHPLKNVSTWKRVGGLRQRECVVVDTSLGAYAWPTYRTTGEPDYLTLLSNGFRGSLATGDEITVTAQTFQMVSSTRKTLVDLVLDPWNDIDRADQLFDFSRDTRFVRSAQ